MTIQDLDKKLIEEIEFGNGIGIECNYTGTYGKKLCYRIWEPGATFKGKTAEGLIPLENTKRGAYETSLVKVKKISKGKMMFAMYINGYSNTKGTRKIRKAGLEVELLEDYGYYKKGETLHIKTKFFFN